MLYLILFFSGLRLLLWAAYEIFEYRNQRIVPHEIINEFVILVGVDALLIPLAIWLLLKITHSVTQPLRSIAESSQEITEGRLDHRIRTDDLPGGELTSVAENLNEAFDRYEQASARNAAFAGNAAHQLRNPLGSIHANAQQAMREEGMPESGLQAVEAILVESERLQLICVRLLAMSRIRQIARKDDTKTDLGTLLASMVEAYQPLAQDQGVRLELSGGAGPVIHLDPALGKELVANLFDNAFRALSEGGRIRISVHQEGGRLPYFLMEDDGPGIPENLAEHLFDRFVRGGQEQGGAGLGLSLCREIAIAHQGSIELVPSEFGGAGFKVVLQPYVDGA